MSNTNETPMTCAGFDAIFADLLEDSLDTATLARANAHIAQCARCRGLLADITELREEAARLPVLRPSHDLWDGIAARIESPVISLDHHKPRLRAWQRPAWLAAAAVVLMAATAGTTWMIARQPADTLSPSARVAQAYAGDIAQLNTLVAKRRPALDSATAQVLASSMRSIDEAIARVRTAVDASPSNVLLAQQLARAYDMKLNTLRTIAAMPAE